MPTAAAAAVITDTPAQAGTTTTTTTTATAARAHAKKHHRRMHFAIKDPSFSVPVGHAIKFHGRLLPVQPGTIVKLVTRAGSGWRTLARTRTGRVGGFTFHYTVPTTGSRWLRVSTRGATAVVGKVTGLTYSVASWYNDAGNTACGFHAYYGVANKTLPCGTKVTFSYGGRTVVATVDDRGPFVPGRDYDFNQNVAGALGMYGVATVESSIA
jgi:rare lipoprotein A (peptidoglycan hydrolase)